ncbi:hypothetical protein DFH82_002766 [Clostridium saccharobutylicum]|nr:hypothetical protein [Clostridium saccharobutylicum]NOW28290.1 hypothetical protein [Clostridium saccharobutylicum]
MKVIKELELEKMIALSKYHTVRTIDINDETLKKVLVYYDFISNNIEDLMLKEDKSKIMYSKYYWYTKYKQRYFEVIGYDAGIEQEGFKLLEEIENELEYGVDWSIIQEIEEG